MARTIVVKDSDEKSKTIINQFNMIAVGKGVNQTDLIIMAMEEYVSRHWSEVVPSNYVIPNENINTVKEI
jgi:hypothetical protein